MAQAIEKTVTTIPARLSRFTDLPLSAPIKRKVAAYARVSTDHEEQQSSYEAQVSYYTDYIQSRTDWEFAGIFADEGISGCSIKGRQGFQAMIEEALNGGINLIITKSVSRFARNTVDSLSTIRKLKEHNVECYFEKENIWTFDSKCELMLSILSSISQEESRSISENVTWGHRQRMADGKVSIPFGRFLGYDRGEHGELIVNEQEAEIVREIYRLFLSGLTPHGIGKELTSRGIPTPGGKVKWTASTVKSILTNEKYKGDALLQKTFTPDYLTKKTKKNDGQIPQYYVENSHPAIVTSEMYDAVQAEMERRNACKSRYSGVDILASKLICGKCGSFYSPKVWHSTNQYRRTIYQCGHKYKGCKCSTPNLTAEAIHAVFIRAFNELITNKNEIIRNLRESIDLASDMTELESQRDSANNEVLFLADIVQKLIAENARIPQDQNEYNKKYSTAMERYEATKAAYDNIIAQIAEKNKRVQRMQTFIKNVQELGVITEFDEELWGVLVESVTVYSKDDIRVEFRN
ncbi:MAG TPA: recombinase family protein [Alphaproteobacteria bacterium]|nr:recombinase family protein [Alphaproteobacteria bacterium]